MLKKILSPIAYVAFLALTLLVILGFTYVVTETIARLTLLWLIVTMSVILFIVGSFFYWFGNYVMAKLENLHKPKIADHFRQSSICYLIACYLLIVYIPFQMPVVHGEYPEGVYTPLNYYIYSILFLSVSIWAIFVNGVFLYKRRKANII